MRYINLLTYLLTYLRAYYEVRYETSTGIKMNDLDLRFEVEPRSCQPLRVIRR